MILKILEKHLDISVPQMISFIGGGGKTSSIIRLARDLKEQNNDVFISTTTKMYAMHPPMIDQSVLRETFDNYLELPKGITLIGERLEREDKLVGVSASWLEELNFNAKKHWVLVEADGSRGRSIKGHKEDEPVIPQNTNIVISVIGADCFNRSVQPEWIHRPEIFADITGLQMNSKVDLEAIVKILTDQRGYFKNCPPTALKIVLINKAKPEDQQWIEALKNRLVWPVEVVPWEESFLL